MKILETAGMVSARLNWEKTGHQTRTSNRLYAIIIIFFLFSSMELLDSYQFIDAESGSKRIICSNTRIRSVSESLTASQSTDNDCLTLSSCYSFVCVLIVHSFFFVRTENVNVLSFLRSTKYWNFVCKIRIELRFTNTSGRIRVHRLFSFQFYSFVTFAHLRT